MSTSTKQTENLAECGNKSKPMLCDVISLELKKVWYERKQNIENKEIAEGIEIEYYGEKNRMIHNPSRGEIKKDEQGFYIEWEDISTKTRIDNSEHSLEILSTCGWV